MTIDIGLSQFPLDPMHLLYLGVMKRLLNFFVKGNKEVRMRDMDIENINIHLTRMRKYIDRRDCARLLRKNALHQIDMWKATEFRQFLLYTGPIVLKNRLPQNQYNHFLSFHCAIRILSTPLHMKYINFAN